jgi:hypothetical protein
VYGQLTHHDREHEHPKAEYRIGGLQWVTMSSCRRRSYPVVADDHIRSDHEAKHTIKPFGHETVSLLSKRRRSVSRSYHIVSTDRRYSTLNPISGGEGIVV